MRKKTNEEFMIDGWCVHGDKFNYKFVKYKNNKTKVIIVCNTCGCVFKQRPGDHLKGCGCSKCASKKCKEKQTLTHNQFENKAKQVHSDKFTYLIKYVNNKTYMTMKCNICGYIFKQKPNAHLNGQGCPHCVGKFKENYASNNIPTFIIYQPQLQPYGVECRRSPKDENVLEIRCIYCGKWYQPALMNVKNKINAIKGQIKGEYNLYCSDNCKLACPVYRKIKYSTTERELRKDLKRLNTSREVQSQLRKMVLERDNWTCQRCGTKEKQLHCHHLTGTEINPIESTDIDNCITFCIDCHNWIHKQKGCTYNDFKRKECKT